MSVNAVNTVTGGPDYNAYSTTATSAVNTKENENTAAQTGATASGAVYEPSQAAPVDPVKQTYKPNTDLVSKMKETLDSQVEQLRSLVQQLIGGQGKAIATANPSDLMSQDIWKTLADGNFTVTEAAKAQAQKDIAEDGYWGVEQTSDRILDFAKALSGGDPSKIEELRGAFQKGFEEATKAWGKELPDISQRTYDATMKKFDDWKNASQSNSAQTNDPATGAQA